MSARQDRAAKRYARAIFDVVEPGRYDALLQLLNGLSVAWVSSPEFRNVISDPSVKTETKQRVLQAVVETLSISPSREESSLLSLLVTAGRVAVLPVLHDHVKELVQEFRRALSLVITSAHELSNDERNSITESLRGKMGADVGIEWNVDPDIIGGLVIRLGDKLLDRSLAGMLQQMKNHITA